MLTSIPPHPDPTDEIIVSWMPSPESGGLDKEDTAVCVPKRRFDDRLSNVQIR